MGCLFSGPLKKTAAGIRIPAKDEEYDEESGADDADARRYYSFGSFLADNETPTIMEWTFHQEIGKGAMSRVFLATNTLTGQRCAAKVYNMSLLHRQTLGSEEPPSVAVMREIEIMAGLSHRFVMLSLGVVEDASSNSLLIIMPLAECGGLQGFIDKDPPTEETLQTCFYQIAEGLRYCHQEKVVHRDLKPDNILVFSGTQFSLSDFSVSARVTGDDQMLSDTRGSPAFLSPEECGGKPFYPKPADVWAYGVTLFSCVFNFLPFKLDQGGGKSVANTVFWVTQLLNREELVVPEDRGFSPDLIALFKLILDKDPAKRQTFEDIVMNPWFNRAREEDRRRVEEEEDENEPHGEAEEEEEGGGEQ